MKATKAIKTKFLLIIISLTFCLSGCNGESFQKKEIEDFIGTWELQGRSMFDGIKIKIIKNKQGELKGEILSLNNNKFVKMFAESNDSWVSSITRKSNYEFKLVEKKLGSALFSVYGLDTSTEFKAQFIDENTIGLSSESGNPQNSSVKYIRITLSEKTSVTKP